MKKVAAIGIEVRHQSARPGRGGRMQEASEVVLMHFLEQDGGLISAHVGRRFPPGDDIVHHMKEALRTFPADGEDFEVVDGYLLPRQKGGRPHMAKPAHLWTRGGGPKRVAGYAVGFGCTLEAFDGVGYFVPYMTIRVETPKGPRNVQARMTPQRDNVSRIPKEEECQALADLLDLFNSMKDDFFKTSYCCACSAEANGQVFEFVAWEDPAEVIEVREPVVLSEVEVPAEVHGTAMGQAFAKALGR